MIRKNLPRTWIAGWVPAFRLGSCSNDMMRPGSPAASFVLVEQRLGRSGDKLRALALAALEEEQALAEDEAVEHEGFCIGLLARKPGGAIEPCHVFEPRRIDARDRIRRSCVRAGPLPDRKLDCHALGVGALGIELDDRFQPLARGAALEARMLFDGGDAA